MVAAAPNAGKSMFALVYAIKAKVPTLFFSADTDAATVMLRASAHLAGHTQETVENQISINPCLSESLLLHLPVVALEV